MTTRAERAEERAQRKLKGNHGGNRSKKMIDPASQTRWKDNLERAIKIAAANCMVLKKGSFFTISDIRNQWGRPAEREFKEWFVAERHYNSDVADTLLQNRIKGVITEEKYEKYLYTKAYQWVWSIPSDHHVAAWQISRGIRKL